MDAESVNAVNESPDWSAISHDVLCPLCDYNLRGLSEPRCPECGYPFDWPEVVERKLRPPNFSVEHDRRFVRAFFVTLARSAWPPVLWSRLKPTHPVNEQRLRIYWLLSASVFIASFAGLVGFNYLEWWSNPGPAPYGLRGGGLQVWDYVSHYFAGEALLVWLLWPWVTMATLMLFGQSMSIAAVKPIHVRRCVLYCCDVGWLVGAIATMVAWDWVQSSAYVQAWSRAAEQIASVTWAYALIVMIRLAFAYRQYLRFPHALGVAVASQIIVMLIFFIVAGMFM